IVALVLIGQWTKQKMRARRFGVTMGEYNHQIALIILIVGCLLTAGGAVWFARKPAIIATTNPPIPRLEPEDQSPPSPVAGAQSNLPVVRKLNPKPSSSSAAPAIIHGSDNTYVGIEKPPSISGDGNTIVGTTDANGNTIFNRGGL